MKLFKLIIFSALFTTIAKGAIKVMNFRRKQMKRSLYRKTGKYFKGLPKQFTGLFARKKGFSGIIKARV